MWFLNMEIDPKKYTEHFKTNLVTRVFFKNRDEYCKFVQQLTELGIIDS